MIIKSLKLVTLRNYSLRNFTFDRGSNFIYGDNAIGKTNLVEGIYYFSLTRSFRTNTESLLINKNASSFYLEGVFIKENKKYNINISLASFIYFCLGIKLFVGFLQIRTPFIQLFAFPEI